MSERIKWIDIAKGISIILVIIGHSISNSIIRGVIFSFHMPLFFLLSGVTSHYSTSINEWWFQIKKNFKKLIMPAMLLTAIRYWGILLEENIVSGTIINFKSIGYLFYNVKEMFLSMIWASGVDVTIGKLTISKMGVAWFLVCLFFTKTLYDGLQLFLDKLKLGISVILITFIGVGISYYIWLPFSLDLAFSVVVFIYIGAKFKEFYLSENKKRRSIIDRKAVSFAILGGGTMVYHADSCKVYSS